MRLAVVFLVACGGGSGGNPDAAHDTAPHPDAAIDAPFCPAAQLVDPQTATELLVGNDAPAQGIFDPSFVYPAAASGGAMAYSAVPGQDTIRTHIAVSADHGASWTMVAEANTPQAATIASSDAVECPGEACTGNLISEVTSLVFDSTDPDANKRWKLFAHRYLVGAGAVSPPLHYVLGTIALQTAPAPDGPWTAPQKLIGWSSTTETYSSTGITTNVNAIGGTAGDCLALTEPGALVLPGAIDLAVGCIYIDNGPKIRIELLRSPDHGATWGSVATLLRPEDAGCLTANASINAANLFALDGHEYLAATPSDATGYHGCLVFEIDDIAAGHVARDGQGRALVHRALAANQFSGACTFADGAGGYALDVGFLQAAKRFRIFTAGIAAP
jgi:hypothetical protein